MKVEISIDAATLEKKSSVPIRVEAGGLYSFQVCKGNGHWPTPFEVGIYLDFDNGKSCIVEWPSPYEPIRFELRDVEYIVFLNTAASAEIRNARSVKASEFRDD